LTDFYFQRFDFFPTAHEIYDVIQQTTSPTI